MSFYVFKVLFSFSSSLICLCLCRVQRNGVSFKILSLMKSFLYKLISIYDFCRSDCGFKRKPSLWNEQLVKLWIPSLGNQHPSILTEYLLAWQAHGTVTHQQPPSATLQCEFWLYTKWRVQAEWPAGLHLRVGVGLWGGLWCVIQPCAGCAGYSVLLSAWHRPPGSSYFRYAESSMKNSFGLKYLHKFFNIPFLQLQVRQGCYPDVLGVWDRLDLLRL